MAGFLLRRILSSIVVLLCAASITFLLSVSQKGGPFEKEKLSELAKAEKEKQYGLDGPRWLQLARYQKRLIFEGDMNVSLRYKDRGVAEVLGQKFPNSLVLGACAFLVASIGGVLAGCVAAMKKDTWVDASAMLVALAAISVPTFITGPVLVAIFGLWLRWLPIGGFGNAAQLVMPSACLALPFMAYVARLMRNSLLDVMSQPHMRTAKAKGLAPAAAIARHAMKVAILPVVTYLGPMAAYVLTGSFVVETVFNIPGVGGVFVNAIQNVDPFLLTGAVIVYAALIVFFNLVVDVVYVFLDKRIRLHG